MITQRTKLNLIPGQVNPRINVTQYDYGSRTLEFEIWNGNQRFLLDSSISAAIQGTKPDNLGYAYTATVDTTNNIVVADLTQQMTPVKGNVVSELVLTKSGERIGTLNFILDVQQAALNDETVISDSELPAIITEATAQMEAAQAAAREASQSALDASGSATSASGSANSASTNALKAEGFAVGQQNGTDVGSDSPYYHNNAEYFKDQASSSASTASDAADRAQAYSVNTPYIGANGNWWVWNTSTGAYVDTGVDASITVDIEDITMLAPDASPYVTNTGTDTDPVFHLFIPRGKGISSITKTGTVGLVDTYTITYSDGNTTTFTVTNGAKGDTGDAAGFGTPTASIDGNIGTPSVTVTASGPDTAKVFNFAFSNLKGVQGEQGQTGQTGATGNGIASIAKTGTSGLVDTYTITFTDGTTTTFTVTNGRDGTGSGDMSQADYDANSAVKNAGGIAAYVADALSNFSTELSGLDDVALNNLANGEILVYNSTTQKWENGTQFSGAYSDLTGKPTLGTAAAKDVPASGNASTTEVVMGDDTRLSDARPASDVYSWAKAATKPTYTASEVGLGNVPNVTTDNQTPTFTEASTRANIVSGETLSTLFGKIMKFFSDLKNVAFSGSYSDLSNTPTLGTAAAKDYTSTITSGSSDLITSGAISTLKEALTDGTLYFTAVACSATTGNFATVSNAKITADHVVAECTFSKPSTITTDVTWTSASGSLTLNGTCTDATCTANITLVRKGN